MVALELVTAVLAILASWAVLGAVLVGLGLLVAPPPEGVDVTGDDVAAAFWMGFAAVLALLQGWHLVAPVGSLPLLVVVAGSAAGMVVRRSTALALARAARPRLLPALGAMAFLAWLANRSLGPPVGDAGLYHLAAIRWAAIHPAVPGLANLHLRLGFNHPSHLWSALLEVGPWRGRSSHLANGLLVAATGLWSLAGLARLARRDGLARARDCFAALFLAPVVGQAVSLFELRISSPDADGATALVVIAAAARLAALLDPERPRGRLRTDLAASLALAALAACMKLSAAPFGLAAAALATAIGHHRLGAAGTRHALVAGSAWAAALGAPWLARGLVLTGYPLFPSAVLPAPVDWRVPADDLARLRGLIRDHVLPPVVQAMRKPGESWIPPWLAWQATRLPELVLLPVLGALAGLGGLLVRGARATPLSPLALPALVAMGVWWAMAPSPRFAVGFAWVAAAALLAAPLARGCAASGWARPAALGLLVGAAIFPAAHRFAAFAARGDAARAFASLLLEPGPDGGFHPSPRVELESRTTRSGLRVLVPVHGQETWDAPLPATPWLSHDLAERRPGDQGAGFAIVSGDSTFR